MKRIILISLVASLMLICSSCGTNNTKDMENILEQYMQDVYAPKTMKQFKDAKEDSRKYFDDIVTERFFVAYSNELTAADKERICDTYTVHGSAENQSDGKERYLIKAYLYPKKGATPIIKNFTFIIGTNGKVEDFIIEDANI